jgi:hypothetical protein
VYQDIMHKLVQHGIPRQEIAAIGEADTDVKKQVLFEKVRQGTVRILLGSTQKMGTGMNVQKRLVALHHADAPWKPAEVEQRDGRILRCPFTHNMARLPGYASNATLPGYASNRVIVRMNWLRVLQVVLTYAKHAATTLIPVQRSVTACHALI